MYGTQWGVRTFTGLRRNQRYVMVGSSEADDIDRTGTQKETIAEAARSVSLVRQGLVRRRQPNLKYHRTVPVVSTPWKSPAWQDQAPQVR